MNYQKMLVIAASVCLLAFFVSGAAHAQVGEIIEDYCAEVAQNVNNTQKELADASEDLEECGTDLDGCFSGQGLFDEPPAACIQDYARCTKRGKKDQKQACSSFLNEFKSDTKGAERDSDRQDVEEEFVAWFNSDSDSRDACILPAQITLLICADELLGEE